MCNVRMCRRGSRLTKEEIKCEHCKAEVDDNELDDEGLCQECNEEAGINRMEAYNDLD